MSFNILIEISAVSVAVHYSFTNPRAMQIRFIWFCVYSDQVKSHIWTLKKPHGHIATTSYKYSTLCAKNIHKLFEKLIIGN